MHLTHLLPYSWAVANEEQGMVALSSSRVLTLVKKGGFDG